MPLATPTLSVVDNALATGVVATIAASDAGATNTLYSSSVNGEVEAGTWTSRGSRTGNGTIAVSLTTLGYYFWYVKSVLAAESTISNLDYEPVTDGADAVETRCLDAVASRLQLLTLAGIATTQIVAISDINNPGGVPNFPCILVSFALVPRTYQYILNQSEYIGIPIAILFCDSDQRGGQSDDNKWAKWRQQAERAFSNQRLYGVSESQLPNDIEPLMTTDPQKVPPIYDKVTSGFTVRVWTRHPRGLGA